MNVQYVCVPPVNACYDIYDWFTSVPTSALCVCSDELLSNILCIRYACTHFLNNTVEAFQVGGDHNLIFL